MFTLLVLSLGCESDPTLKGETETTEVADSGWEEDSTTDTTEPDTDTTSPVHDWEVPSEYVEGKWHRPAEDDAEPVGTDVYGELICSEPLPGEPPGQSDGLVCTEQSMHGCTEAGRRFDDYVSCESLYDTRGYYPVPVEYDTTPDARLDDPEWVEEYEWMTEQAASCSCVCCHSDISTPEGPAKWFIEADPIWINSADDYAMAFFAGWVDSSNFGMLPPWDNNGFDRGTTGIPTTDIDRMKAFLEGELERRGRTEEEYEGAGGGGFPF